MEQHIIKDRVAFRVGKVLPFAIYDYFAFKSPKSGFLNQTFTVNPTISYPSFGLGAAALVRPTEDIYIVGGIHDANGKPTTAGFDSFFNESEYFSVVEVGWSPALLSGRRETFFDGGDYHVTFWHVDERTSRGVPDGDGFTVAAEQPIGAVTPFLRYGYASGDATALKHMVAGGVAFTNVFGFDSDVIGLGASWGRTNDGKVPVDILSNGDFVFETLDGNDQYAFEVFYRVQLTPRLTITPDVQLIVDPAFNANQDVIGVFGFRTRIAL